MRSLLALTLLVLVAMCAPAASFAPMQSRTRTSSHLYEASDADKLRESAQKLRDEAQSLESKLDRKPNTAFEREAPPVSYTKLEDSIWTLTYRFSSDPPDDGNDDKDEEDRPVSRYSGKLTVKFLADGYTDLISHEPTGANALTISKVWGWDKETSNEDEEEYILFSTNIQVPETDLTSPNEVLRFYWQARIDEDSNISFDDGTVTVKKDVGPPGGFWGVFNGSGILAQFRYVGNFAAKATE